MKKIRKFKERNLLISFLCIILVSSLGLAGYWIVKKEQVKVTVKGEEIIVDSYAKTVKDVLEENNIIYDKDDIIEPSLNTKLKDYMGIKLTYVENITVSEHERINYETKTVKDKTLAKGVSVVTQEGKKGRKTIVYEEVYHDDKLVSRVIEKEIIREKPVDEIITKGSSTSYYAKTSINNSNSSSSYKSSGTTNYSVSGNKMIVSATAYNGGTVTATGTRPRWGTIAVDPRIIPYGTRVYIPQFNMTFVAEDCGGGIKGNRIDIYMNSKSQCINWGVRSIDIYVGG